MSTLNPDDRAAWIDGLRSLACFLEAHPDVPVPERYHTQYLSVIPHGGEDERRAAASMPCAAISSGSSRTTATARAITRRCGRSARWPMRCSSSRTRGTRGMTRALNSYSGSVRLDDDPAVAA